MIPFDCPTCGGRLEVPDEYVGRQCRCPSCGTVAVVHSGRTRGAGDTAHGPAAGADDIAAALSASWHPASHDDPAPAGAGGNVQYDLSLIFGTPAAAGEAPAATQGAAADAEAPPAEPFPSEPLFAMPSAGVGSTRSAPTAPPEYAGVRAVGVLSVALGGVCALGGVGLLLALAGDALLSDDLSGALAAGWPGLAVAIGLLVGGTLQVALGLLTLCVRDLARNSFHLRRL